MIKVITLEKLAEFAELFKGKIDNLLKNKVDKEDGKGLSTNDYTTVEKQKLEGIQAKAQENVVEGVQINGVDQNVNNKKVNIDLSPYAKKTDISNVYTFKGSVNTYADLPKSNQKIGDTYDVKTADSVHGVKAGDNLSWTGTEWDNLGGKVDLTAYALKTDLNNKVNKEDGKGLSTEDFTSAEKQKLAELNNIEAITNEEIEQLWTQVIG